MSCRNYILLEQLAVLDEGDTIRRNFGKHPTTQHRIPEDLNAQ